MIVYASAAVSLDGYIDDLSSERLVLSGPSDWNAVRTLRAGYDAILVGAETIRRDNPGLTTKDERLRKERIARGTAPDPIKITISRSGKLDPGSRFFTEGDSQKIVLVGKEAAEEHPDGLRRVATVIRSTETELTAAEILRTLDGAGIRSLFIEGGTHVLTLFLSENRIDYLRIAVAPFFVGESGAPRLVGAGRFPFHKGKRMYLTGTERLGDMAVLNYALKTDLRDEERMRLALEEARKCPASRTAYSVGAVIVTPSGRVFTGYSRETAPSNHAEEEAVLKADAAECPLEGATLYSTMEPCSSRKSKEVSCSRLIINRRMGRVVFAAYEPAHFVRCCGERMLSEAGIEVNVLAALSREALDINAHILYPQGPEQHE